MGTDEEFELLSKKFEQASAMNFRERTFSRAGGKYDYATQVVKGKLFVEVVKLSPGEAVDNPLIVMKVLEYLEAQSIAAYNRASSTDDHKKKTPFFSDFLASALTSEENFDTVLPKAILRAADFNPNTMLSEGVKGILLTSATARGFSEEGSLKRIEEAIRQAGKEAICQAEEEEEIPSRKL